MNVSIESLGPQWSLLKVSVGAGDYEQVVGKTLKEYRRKANVPGFRPGMVPMGLINKMYRKGVLAEESYKLASKAAFDYIEKEGIDYLGDVLPSERQGELDFDGAGDLEFVFEIGIAPAVEVDLAGLKVARYDIKPDDTMLANYRSNFLRRYGRLEDVDVVSSDEALSVTLDNSHMNVADAYVGLIQMDEKARKPFIGKKAGDSMSVDINKLYPTPSQRAAILKVKEDELAAVDPKFTLTITKIRKFVEPTLGEEFFGMAFPDGSVKDEAGFDAFIGGQVARDLGREAEYLFTFQVRKLLLDKANLAMPEAFLGHWLFTINEGKFTKEQIESELPQFVDMMRWNLVQKYFAEKLEVKVQPDDALVEAKAYAAAQFAQYGMANVQDDMLENYAKQVLQNKDEARKIYDKLFEQKIIEAVTPMLKVTAKTVSPDEFTKIAEKL